MRATAKTGNNHDLGDAKRHRAGEREEPDLAGPVPADGGDETGVLPRGAAEETEMEMRVGSGSRSARGVWPGVALALLGVALALLGAPAVVRAGMMIQPSLIETKLDGGTYASTLVVTSSDTTAQRYRIKVEHFVFNEKGTVRTVPPDEHSLAPWIKLNPKEFELAPKESRMIRIAVVPPARVKPGEYWAALEFEPLQGQVAEAERDGRTVTLQIISSILVPVIGQVGQLNYAADVRGLQAWKSDSGIEVRARVGNDGSGRVRLKGTYQVVGGDGASASEGVLGEGTILVGQERVFGQRIEGRFPDGCSVRVKFGSGKLSQTLAGEVRVQESAPPEVQPAVLLAQPEPKGETADVLPPGAETQAAPSPPFGGVVQSAATRKAGPAGGPEETQTSAPTGAPTPG
jgi:hypothetical protein